MINPKKDIDFSIKEFPKYTEMTSTKLYGFIGGIKYLLDNNYEIQYNALTIKGSMYIALGVKGEEEEVPVDENINKLKLENRTLKAQVTKLQKKVKK